VIYELRFQIYDFETQETSYMEKGGFELYLAERCDHLSFQGGVGRGSQILPFTRLCFVPINPIIRFSVEMGYCNYINVI
jgi:hypothetical protein